MKKFNVYLFLILFACNEDTYEVNSPQLADAENYLVFSTSKEFFNTIEKIGRMTEVELDVWEESNKFISYRTHLNNAQKEWALISDQSQIPLFEDKYKDILKLVNGSLEPYISNNVFRSFVNRNGIYKTDQYLNKVINNIIYTVEHGEIKKLESLSSRLPGCQIARLAAASGISSLQYTQENQIIDDECSNPDPNPNPPPVPRCYLNMEASYFANSSGCSDDREVYISASSYITPYSGLREFDGTFKVAYYKQAYINIKVWGKKRNWLCNWATYATSLEYTVWELEINAHRVLSSDANGTISEIRPFIFNPYQLGPSVDREWMDYPVKVGDLTINETIQPYAFTKLKVEGKTRGTGSNGYARMICP